MGLELNLTGHEAFGISGEVHIAFEFIPEDQAYWQGRLEQTTPDGRSYMTLSGDSAGLSPDPFSAFGDTQIIFDRPSHQFGNNFYIVPVTHPPGIGENQFGEMMITAAKTYNQNPVPYNPSPDNWLSGFAGTNSTGTTLGLISSQGGTTLIGNSSLGSLQGLGTDGAQSLPPLINDGGMSYESPPAIGSGASGGFVLYPSRPNTNSLKSAYRK